MWHVIEKRVQACTMYVRQCRTNDRIGKSVQNGCEEQLQSIDHILQISQSELSDSRVGGWAGYENAVRRSWRVVDKFVRETKPIGTG